MGNEDKATIIRPPDALKGKVTVGGAGAVDLEALERAEAVIASMADNYLEWVEEDLIKIANALDALKNAAVEDRKNFLDPIFQIAHDMKGQGGSFNYDLMTILGDGLCRFIDQIKAAGNTEIEIIKLYINTMRIVISNRMSGTGGAEGEQVLKGLDMVVAKILGK